MKKAIAETKKAQGMPAGTFFNVMLGEVERLLESPISYFASVEDNEETLVMRGWSRNVMGACKMLDKPIVYKVVDTGMWGDAVRERKAVITNDYPGSTKPTKKGHPEGHVKVTRHMNIPVFDGSTVVGVLGIGNREREYDDADAAKMTEFITAVWSVVKTKCV